MREISPLAVWPCQTLTLIADGDRESKTTAMLRPVAADYDELGDTLDRIASQTAAFAEPDSQPENPTNPGLAGSVEPDLFQEVREVGEDRR